MRLMSFQNKDLETISNGGRPDGVPILVAARFRALLGFLKNARSLNELEILPSFTLERIPTSADPAYRLTLRVGWWLSFTYGSDQHSISDLDLGYTPPSDVVASPVHPGIFLQQEVLQPLNISQKDLAELLGVARTSLSAMLNASLPIPIWLALRLEKVVGVSADTVMHMQTSWDLHQARAIPGDEDKIFRRHRSAQRKPDVHADDQPAGA